MMYFHRKGLGQILKLTVGQGKDWGILYSVMGSQRVGNDMI